LASFSVPNPLSFTLMSLELDLGDPYYNYEESPLLYTKSVTPSCLDLKLVLIALTEGGQGEGFSSVYI